MKTKHEHDHSNHHHEEAEGMHASRMSQLGNEPCTVEDSEEMASLRNAEDASTLMKLGGLLISQYRYREAIPVMEKAAELFANHPGDDAESRISAIYWNTLSCCRAGVDQEMLYDFDPDMDAGHHDAYKKAMLVFAGYTDPSDISFGQSELDDAITQYGLSVYYEGVGDNELAGRMLKLAADHETVWPCISCLAAWKDIKRQ